MYVLDKAPASREKEVSTATRKRYRREMKSDAEKLGLLLRGMAGGYQLLAVNLAGDFRE